MFRGGYRAFRSPWFCGDFCSDVRTFRSGGHRAFRSRWVSRLCGSFAVLILAVIIAFCVEFAVMFTLFVIALFVHGGYPPFYAQTPGCEKVLGIFFFDDDLYRGPWPLAFVDRDVISIGIAVSRIRMRLYTPRRTNLVKL